MYDFLSLHGYAVPFGQMVFVDKKFEMIERGAFAQMLDAPLPDISVRWSGHDDDAPELAHTKRNSLQLFADDYGLGFRAVLDMRNSERGLSDNWARLGDISRRIKPVSFCSINLHVGKETCSPYLGHVLHRITDASIDHISLVSDPAYKNTGVWLADPNGKLQSQRLSDLAERWNAGWQASVAARKALRPAKNQSSLSVRNQQREDDIRVLRQCGFSPDEIARLERRKLATAADVPAAAGRSGEGRSTSPDRSNIAVKQTQIGARHG
jgi:phage head maturation protease